MKLDNNSWWKEGVFYQIYPSSFADSNSDGIGDLPGIISKLPYLENLGIDAIWLSPIYPSPMADFGYDVAHYCDIDPIFGTMDDFNDLLKKAHEKGIKIILDLVFNHTSHLHPWFLESRSSRNNPKRDWYIWADPLKGKRPPNNWQSVFGGKAWEWDQSTGQFYLHSFAREQPDLNWRNPEVRKALFEVIRFWLTKGVDGFRLDVVNYFLKDEKLRSNPWKPGLRPYDMQHHFHDKDQPETPLLMKEIRQVVDEFPGRMTVGEVDSRDLKKIALYYGTEDGLHLNFNFNFLEQPWNPGKFQSAVLGWEKILKEKGWPAYTLSNHDVPRHMSRYGNCPERARIAAAMLLSLRGTPFLYYGEEIGMQQVRLPRHQIKDPVGRRYWPFHPGRDGSRTPMQWDESPNAGFTAGNPWLPVSPNYQYINCNQQEKDTGSLLNFYRDLIACRKKSEALRRGSIRFLKDKPEGVLAYERTTAREKVLIFLNFLPEKIELTPPAARSYTTLFTRPDRPAKLQKGKLFLPPHSLIFLKC